MKEFTKQDFEIIEDFLVSEGWLKLSSNKMWYKKQSGYIETFEAYLFALKENKSKNIIVKDDKQLKLFDQDLDLKESKNLSSGIKMPKTLIRQLTSDSIKRLLKR